MRRLGLAVINCYTKFEVSMFTHYKDMKATKKVEIGVVWVVRGHPMSPTMSPFDRRI